MKTEIRQRTCRACRKKKDKKKLLRLVIVTDKTLEVDLKQTMPGRGWYLCPEGTCLFSLKVAKSRNKSFGRDLEIGPRLKDLIEIPSAGGINGQN